MFPHLPKKKKKSLSSQTLFFISFGKWLNKFISKLRHSPHSWHLPSCFKHDSNIWGGKFWDYEKEKNYTQSHAETQQVAPEGDGRLYPERSLNINRILEHHKGNLSIRWNSSKWSFWSLSTLILKGYMFLGLTFENWKTSFLFDSAKLFITIFSPLIFDIYPCFASWLPTRHP